MRKRASLNKTITDLEQFLEDGNKIVCYVHVGIIMNAVEWLKEYQSKIEPGPSHEDIDGVPHCGAEL